MPKFTPSTPSLILIADDDEDILALMSVSFERAGNTVLTARDGEEALDLVLERRPDLVMLDVAMPNLTGYEVLREIRAAVPGARVILVSAYATEEFIAEGWKEGADDYIVKPFRSDELSMRAAAVLAAPIAARASVARPAAQRLVSRVPARPASVFS